MRSTSIHAGLRHWAARRMLNAQHRLLATLEAGSARVRRSPEAFFAWLQGAGARGPAGNFRERAANELMGPAYAVGKFFFKFEHFFLRPRLLVVEQRLRALENSHE